jgi:hypothetical protein
MGDEERRRREKEREKKAASESAPASDDVRSESEPAVDERSDAAIDEASQGGRDATKKSWTTAELVAALRARARKLQDGSPYVNDQLLRATARRRDDAVDPLLEVLGDSRWTARWAALAALARVALKTGAKGRIRDALPKLLAAVDDEQAHVRAKAIEALAPHRWAKEQVLQALLKAIGDAKADVSRAAVMHLLELGLPPAELTEKIIEILTTKRSVYHRVGALMVLFHLGKSAKAAMPHLLEAIEDPSAEVREYANLALMGIRTPSMRLQIIRTASMRLKAVDDPSDEVPAKKEKKKDRGEKADKGDKAEKKKRTDEESDDKKGPVVPRRRPHRFR